MQVTRNLRPAASEPPNQGKGAVLKCTVDGRVVCSDVLALCQLSYKQPLGHLAGIEPATSPLSGDNRITPAHPRHASYTTVGRNWISAGNGATDARLAPFPSSRTRACNPGPC